MKEFVSPRGNVWPNPVTQQVAIQLATRAVAMGGFTWRTSNGEYPAKGFAVSVKGPERILDGLSALDIVAFGHEHAQTIAAGNLVFSDSVCIGAWLNQATGKWHLDLSVVVKSLDEAMVLGRANNQLAVYDLGAQREHAITYAEASC